MPGAYYVPGLLEMKLFESLGMTMVDVVLRQYGITLLSHILSYSVERSVHPGIID